MWDMDLYLLGIVCSNLSSVVCQIPRRSDLNKCKRRVLLDATLTSVAISPEKLSGKVMVPAIPPSPGIHWTPCTLVDRGTTSTAAGARSQNAVNPLYV